MAGLYDTWKTAIGDEVFSFTILTTDSSEKLTWCAQEHVDASELC